MKALASAGVGVWARAGRARRVASANAKTNLITPLFYGKARALIQEMAGHLFDGGAGTVEGIDAFDTVGHPAAFDAVFDLERQAEGVGGGAAGFVSNLDGLGGFVFKEMKIAEFGLAMVEEGSEIVGAGDADKIVDRTDEAFAGGRVKGVRPPEAPVFFGQVAVAKGL